MEEVKSPQAQRANKASEPIDVVDLNGRPRSVRDHNKGNSKQKSEGFTKPSSTGGHDAAEPFGGSYNVVTMLCSMKQIGLSSEFVSMFLDLNLNLVYARPSIVNFSCPSSLPIPTRSFTTTKPLSGRNRAHASRCII